MKPSQTKWETSFKKESLIRCARLPGHQPLKNFCLYSNRSFRTRERQAGPKLRVYRLLARQGPPKSMWMGDIKPVIWPHLPDFSPRGTLNKIGRASCRVREQR